MNKLIFGGILSLLISGNLPAAAQQPGQYVRKALPQPAFFVPQKDIQYQEKLPPFNLPPQPAEVKVQTTVEKVQYSEPAFQPEVISDNKEESVPDEFNPNLDITLPEVPQEKAEPQAATPKYQQEYAAYVKDLQAIEQSGQALPNQELEDDLAQMGSEQRLEVDAGGKILNPFSQAQLINPMAEAPVRDASVPKAAKKSTAQILDKVEIIRRPPQQEELSAQDNAPDNPFADRAELPAIQPAEEVPLSPEVAAHFGGLNPFAGGDAERTRRIAYRNLSRFRCRRQRKNRRNLPRRRSLSRSRKSRRKRNPILPATADITAADRTAAVRSPPVTALILSVRIQTSADKVFINDFKQINIFDFGTLVDPVH